MRKYFLLPIILFSLMYTNASNAQCALNESFTVNPLPTNGTYAPGDVVSVCYTVGGYFQNGANWIHGFDLSFGNGWDLGSLTITTLPSSCSGSGTWEFFNSFTSNNGNTFGPGVFYDYNPGDGNPGNNYGDYNSTGFCTWTLCFDIKVDAACVNGDLSIGVQVTGDGYSGSWTNSGLCNGILNTVVTATCDDPCTYVITPTPTDPTCVGSDGSISLSGTGGIAPYSYNWSTGETTSAITGLNGGTFSVTATDSAGCQSMADVTLPSVPVIILTFTSTPTSCYGYTDGSVSVDVQNGMQPYTYAWLPAGQSNDTITNLPAGTYYLTVTDPNGCSANGNVVVVQPQPILLGFNAADVTCNGGSNGWIEAVAVQGTQPYTFNWSNGDSTFKIINQVAGTYLVTVTDAGACSLDSSATITEPPPISVNFGMTPASCDVANDGVDTAQAYGGTPGYNYVWNTVPQTIGNTAQNLSPGMYTVTVTDVNNCVHVDSNYVVAFPVFDITASDDQQIVRGFWTEIEVTVDTSGYFNYEWVPGDGLGNPFGSSTVASPDSTTTYIITVSDNVTGCQSIDTVVVFVLPSPYLNVPNAFSPNADGLNDMFFPIPGDGVKVKSFRIYDRWGEKLYDGDPYPGWDGRYSNGKPCPLGVYAYYCEFVITESQETQRNQGTVFLAR